MLWCTGDVLRELWTAHHIFPSKQARNSEYSVGIQLVSTLYEVWRMTDRVEGIPITSKEPRRPDDGYLVQLRR
jgi:hypothetical protein